MDPHCRDSDGWTALHYAAYNGWTDVCRLLVEQYQVDPHCRDSMGGQLYIQPPRYSTVPS